MKKLFSLLLVPALSLALVGCDVDVTEEGRLPDLDVDVEGTAGEMPELDVRGPEVTTGTKTVEVPTIDVDIPEENENEPEEVAEVE